MARSRSPSEELLRRSRQRVGGMDTGPEPRRRAAVVTCMDARIDPLAFRDFERGDVHVIRNAGGLVTSDVIRSLIVSQRRLGTREVMVVMHTGCGMLGLDEDRLRGEIAADAGKAPQFGFGSFESLEDAVRSGVEAVAANPWLPSRDRVRGFVYDVTADRLRQVT